MLELNRSYEARFLGREILTSAVTSDLLCRLVHQLPDAVQGGSRCTVLCSAAGLIVTSPGKGGKSVLRVPLSNILFCHVDKARPEVTVWVVRTRDITDNGDSGHLASANPILSAYVYKCLNPNDALGLFQVYNEMNRQAKLDRYRRNVEKKEEMTTVVDSRDAANVHSHSKDSDSDDSQAASSSGVSSSSNTSLAPSTESNGQLSNALKSSPKDSRVWNNDIPEWTSIAGSIENYKGFSSPWPRDKQVREAVLAELREKLRSRHSDNVNDDPDKKEVPDQPPHHGQMKRIVKPLTDTSNMTNAKVNSKMLVSNRQRKPAKVIQDDSPSATSQPEKIIPAYNFRIAPAAQHPVRTLPFPLSMTNALKRLTHKNNNSNSYTAAISPSSTLPPGFQGPMWMVTTTSNGPKGPRVLATPRPPPHHHHPSPSQNNILPSVTYGITKKFKSKKKDKELSPQTPTIPPRIVTNNMDPYFYLPPISRHNKQHPHDTKGGPFPKKDTFVPVLPPAWIHHRVKETKIPEAIPPVNKDKDQKKGRVKSSLSSPGSHKKKVFVVHGLGRFARGFKKKSSSSPLGMFNRTASTTSHESSSSEYGPDGKLRSVMKKPKETDDTSPPEQKKNVTFHAFATVQVLP